MNTIRKSISRYSRSIGPEYSKIYNDKEMAYLGISRQPMIIGITGPTKSGKTMVARYLVTEYGFHYECLSSIIRERASYLGFVSPNWEKMRDIVKVWRSEDGPSVLIDVLMKKLEREGILREGRTIVVDAVLHPKEYLALKKLPFADLIAITASPELRYESTKAWEKNPPSWEEFIKRDRWECGLRDNNLKPEEEEPNINECIRLTPKRNRFEYKDGVGARENLFEGILSHIRQFQARNMSNLAFEGICQ